MTPRRPDTLAVGRNTIVIDHEEHTVTTIFEDGSKVVAAPNYDEESYQRARSLGYGGPPRWAVWCMTRDHDLAHMLIANARGKPHSEVLYSVANGGSCDPAVVHEEECLALLLQHVKNEGFAMVRRKTE
jgi:hypothetical protein